MPAVRKHISTISSWVMILILLFPVMVSAGAPITIGFDVGPPWKVLDGKGCAAGPEAELMLAISDRLKLDTDFRILPFKRCLSYFSRKGMQAPVYR